MRIESEVENQIHELDDYYYYDDEQSKLRELVTDEEWNDGEMVWSIREVMRMTMMMDEQKSKLMMQWMKWWQDGEWSINLMS